MKPFVKSSVSLQFVRKAYCVYVAPAGMLMETGGTQALGTRLILDCVRNPFFLLTHAQCAFHLEVSSELAPRELLGYSGWVISWRRKRAAFNMVRLWFKAPPIANANTLQSELQSHLYHLPFSVLKAEERAENGDIGGDFLLWHVRVLDASKDGEIVKFTLQTKRWRSQLEFLLTHLLSLRILFSTWSIRVALIFMCSHMTMDNTWSTVCICSGWPFLTSL